jgi:hypothetical protein
MDPLRAVGFWFRDMEPELPRPQLLVPSEHGAEERAALVRYLGGGRVFESYRGYSSCRFRCAVPIQVMGSRDFSDGRWVWPEGLAHYVREHHVRLPDDTSQLALVHLTWSAKEEPEGFPRTVMFETWAEWNGWRKSEN